VLIQEVMRQGSRDFRVERSQVKQENKRAGSEETVALRRTAGVKGRRCSMERNGPIITGVRQGGTAPRNPQAGRAKNHAGKPRRNACIASLQQMMATNTNS
jgi:hypothetical protein